MVNAHPYNYDRFEFDSYAGPSGGVTAGDDAADGKLYTVDGRSIRASSLWGERPIVLEFGSITCPIFTAKIERMDRMADTFSGIVDFYTVYTREAHPGNRYSSHESLAEKRRCAAALRERESVTREILIDGIDGSVHRAYGALPNAVFLIGTDGIVAYRADWLVPDELERKIEELRAADGNAQNVTAEERRENFHRPRPEFLKETVKTGRRAGHPSLYDLLRSIPSMLRYRLRKTVGRTE